MLALRGAGTDLLAGKDNSVEPYRSAFVTFFAGSKLAAESPSARLAGIAFAPFLVGGKKSVLEIVNRNFDLVKGTPDRYMKFADAIRRTLPMLEPKCLRFTSIVRGELVAEIVDRVDASVMDGTLAAFKKGEV